MSNHHLLEGRYEPITHCIGFLQAALRDLVQSFEAWLRPQGREQVQLFESTLEHALSAMRPLTGRRILLVETKSTWTAVFRDSATGPEGDVPYIAREHPCWGLRITCVEDTYEPSSKDGQLGAVQFELFAPHETWFLNHHRAISASNDGAEWRFDTSCDPLPFEQVDRYAAPRLRDRFTPDMLCEYCLALGIRPFDEDFYGPAFALFPPG